MRRRFLTVLIMAAGRALADSPAAALSWEHNSGHGHVRGGSNWAPSAFDWRSQLDRPGDYRCDAFWDASRTDCHARWRDQRHRASPRRGATTGVLAGYGSNDGRYSPAYRYGHDGRYSKRGAVTAMATATAMGSRRARPGAGPTGVRTSSIRAVVTARRATAAAAIRAASTGAARPTAPMTQAAATTRRERPPGLLWLNTRRTRFTRSRIGGRAPFAIVSPCPHRFGPPNPQGAVDQGARSCPSIIFQARKFSGPSPASC